MNDNRKTPLQAALDAVQSALDDYNPTDEECMEAIRQLRLLAQAKLKDKRQSHG